MSFDEKDFFDLRATLRPPPEEGSDQPLTSARRDRGRPASSSAPPGIRFNVERSSMRSSIAIDHTIDALECLCVGGAFPMVMPAATLPMPEEPPTLRDLPPGE